MCLFTDNDPHFIAKFFENVCCALGIKHLLTNTYQQQTSWEAERFNRTLASILSNYLAEHHSQWDEYVQTSVYKYNNHVYRSTVTTNINLTSVHVLPLYLVILQGCTSHQDITSDMMPTHARWNSRKRFEAIIKAVQTDLDRAQKRYTAKFDLTFWFTPQFSPEYYVHLDRPQRENNEMEDIATKLLPHSNRSNRLLKSHGHTFIIGHDGLQVLISTDRVSLAPRPPDVSNRQPSLHNMAPIQAPSTPCSPMAATPPNKAKTPRDLEVSSTTPTRRISRTLRARSSPSIMVVTNTFQRKMPNGILL